MIQQRNLGVTEARIGLTVITCLLVVLGFVIVHRLGDSATPTDIGPAPTQPSVQVSSAADSQPQFPGSGNDSDARYGNADMPTTNPQTSYRPQWLSPQNDTSGVSLPTLGIDDSSAHQPERLDPFGSELRSSLIPDANPKR
jgi:hypothetical protein